MTFSQFSVYLDRWIIYMVIIVGTKPDKILDQFIWLSWRDDSCSIVMTAFLGSTAIFACFTGAALLAKRREYLFLGGILSSVMSTMLLMNIGSLFFGRGAFMFNVEVLWSILPEWILQSDSLILDWQHRTNLATCEHNAATLHVFLINGVLIKWLLTSHVALC